MNAVGVALTCALALFAIGALAPPLSRWRAGGALVYAGAGGVAGIAAVTAALALWAGGTAESMVLPLGLPWIGAHFRLDALSAVLLLLVNLGGATASLYGIGYGRHEPSPGRVLPFFAAFLAGMNLVVLADDAFTFLWSWEVMSLASWALVMAHHTEPESRRGGTVYLIMAVFGTMLLLLAFGLLAGTSGGYAFDAMRGQARAPWLVAAVLLLALFGAGSKAGLVPLHVWLPLAHPAAPSHVSALMSGVMTKVAIYAFIRIVFDLLGTPPWWSGLLVLAIGGLTAVFGILSALIETDIKRALACSTIENVGIVFISLGLALAFRADGLMTAGALALTAGLFHMLNHSLYKSLLFMGAGAVLTATGTRDMEQLGGLIHRLPVTSALFLLGAVAISALPPLNGFVSEWLAFQAVLLSPELPQWALRLEVPAVGAALALAAALTGAAFVRIFGISFLGRPRSEAAARAREVDRFSLAAMGVLGALCVLAGVLPGVVVDALQPAARLLVGAGLPPQGGAAWLLLVPVSASRSSYGGLLVLVFMALSAGLAAWFIHRFASRAVRRAIAWGCGFAGLGLAGQYSASGFSQPLRRVFAPVAFPARETVELPPPGDPIPARFTLRLADPAWVAIYTPLAGAVGFAADRLNPLQYLTIRRYLAIVFALLVGLLVAVAIWR
jgi:formate hydrogenlyase subunit 3/multisubunit Na+/H+ antiporter MnhD subunit